MPNSNPFTGLGSSVPVTAPSGSASATTTLPGVGGNSIKVYNSSTVPVSFRVGVGAQTATAADTIVAPGITEIFGMQPASTDVSVWGIGGTGAVYFQRGDGM